MSLSARQWLLLYIALAFVIDYIPLVKLPFLWSETFFHEISHGIAAIVSGGVIHNIRLNFDGSGVCTTSGGVRFLVSFAGYAGSAFWGFVIYRIANAFSTSSTKYIVVALLLMLATTLLLWARDASTIVILLVLLLLYTSQLNYFPSLSIRGLDVRKFMQLVGVFVILDAIRSPLYLLDGRDLGDGANLSQLTFLPEIFWVAVWFLIALAFLYALWKNPATLRSQ